MEVEAWEIVEAAEWVGALMAAAAAAGPGGEAGLAAAVEVFDGLAELVSLGDYAADAVGLLSREPGAAELVECLGMEGVSDALAWAALVLAGHEAGEPPGAVEALAECASWAVGPGGLPPTLTAAAVMVTLSAALHPARGGL